MQVKSESEVAQSCPTLSNPMDCSLPGSSVHGIFQARVLEWVAIAFFGGSFPDPRIKPGSPALQAEALLSEPGGKPIDIELDNSLHLFFFWLTFLHSFNQYLSSKLLLLRHINRV